MSNTRTGTAILAAREVFGVDTQGCREAIGPIGEQLEGIGFEIQRNVIPCSFKFFPIACGRPGFQGLLVGIRRAMLIVNIPIELDQRPFLRIRRIGCVRAGSRIIAETLVDDGAQRIKETGQKAFV